MAQTQPERSDEHRPGSGPTPQLSLVSAPSDAAPTAAWFTECAWCRRIKVRGRWLDEPAALDVMGAGPMITHGICPTCFSQVTLQAAAERRRRSA